MAALNENNDKENKSCGVVAMCFASIYAVLVFIVYYAECTTVHMNTGLSEEVLSIISYGNTGSLFSIMTYWVMHLWLYLHSLQA